jgi:hypothetical protein
MVLEELTIESIRGEIIQSSYVGLDEYLGYFILVA